MLHLEGEEDGQKGPHGPHQLESALKAGERPAVVGTRGVALNQRVERQLGCSAAESHQPADDHRPTQAAQPGREYRAGTPKEQDTQDDPLLGQPPSHHRCQPGAQERPDTHRKEHQAEVPGWRGRAA